MKNQLRYGFNLKRYKRFIKEAGVPKNKMAEELGISASQFHRYFVGDTIPPLSHLVEISNRYGFDLAQILELEKDIAPSKAYKALLQLRANTENTIYLVENELMKKDNLIKYLVEQLRSLGADGLEKIEEEQEVEEEDTEDAEEHTYNMVAEPKPPMCKRRYRTKHRE